MALGLSPTACSEFLDTCKGGKAVSLYHETGSQNQVANFFSTVKQDVSTFFHMSPGGNNHAVAAAPAATQ